MNRPGGTERLEQNSMQIAGALSFIGIIIDDAVGAAGRPG